MILAVFRRRLREGLTFADFERAWEAERGFGVPTRVLNAIEVGDGRDILTIGFVDAEPDALASLGSDVESAEAQRHDEIADVIESTELRAFFEIATEHDFTGEPRAIDLASSESILSALR